MVSVFWESEFPESLEISASIDDNVIRALTGLGLMDWIEVQKAVDFEDNSTAYRTF